MEDLLRLGTVVVLGAIAISIPRAVERLADWARPRWLRATARVATMAPRTTPQLLQLSCAFGLAAYLAVTVWYIDIDWWTYNWERALSQNLYHARFWLAVFLGTALGGALYWHRKHATRPPRPAAKEQTAAHPDAEAASR
jgi:predicted MFS family arabinose efflux permease